MDQVRHALALLHYSERTATAYQGWIRRYIRFHNRTHPLQLNGADIAQFLSSLAIDDDVSASTQNQALAALLFLYQNVLHRKVERLDLVQAKRPKRLPVVMSREEVAVLLSKLGGVCHLMAQVLYGAGLRLQECVTLRAKDVDFGNCQLVVRCGKGQKDRVALLPRTLVEPLRSQLRFAERQHQSALVSAAGYVALPNSLAVKYPNASREWPWRSEAARSLGSSNHHDLHPCCWAWAVWRSKPPRPNSWTPIVSKRFRSHWAV